MKRKKLKYQFRGAIILIFSMLLVNNGGLFAQEPDAKKIDSVKVFVPNSTKAVIYSAIFPGLGQIYNRKYWKLPIVYGGFLGCVYAISWNTTTYNGYRNAYRDVNAYTRATDPDRTALSWVNYLPYSGRDNPDQWLASYGSNFKNTLKNSRDFHRRNRDLSYIVTVGLYALAMIDAYVDAELFEFDISEDLSMRMQPVMFERMGYQSQGVGLQCSIAF